MLGKLGRRLIGQPSVKDPEFTDEEKRLLYLLTAGFDLNKAHSDIAADARATIAEFNKSLQDAIRQGDKEARRHWEREIKSISNSAFERGKHKTNTRTYCHRRDSKLEISAQCVRSDMVEEVEDILSSSDDKTVVFALRMRDKSKSVPPPDKRSRQGSWSEPSHFFESFMPVLHKWLGKGHVGHTYDGIEHASFDISAHDLDVLQKIHNEMKNKISPEEVEEFRTRQRGEEYPFVFSSIKLLSQGWYHPWFEPPAPRLGQPQQAGGANYTGKISSPGTPSGGRTP